MWYWNVNIRNLNHIHGLLLLVLASLPLTASTNIDCLGKAFHCVNSTHFMICVDIGAGFSSTIDDFVIPCPPTTVCQQNNRFECEFAPTTTQAPTTVSYVKQNMQWYDPTKQTHENIISSTHLDLTTISEDYNTISTTTLASVRNGNEISTSTSDHNPPGSSVTDNYFWSTSPLFDETNHSYKEKRASNSVNEVVDSTTDSSLVYSTAFDVQKNTVDTASSISVPTSQVSENVPEVISTTPSTTEILLTSEFGTPKKVDLEISVTQKVPDFLNVRKSTYLSNLVSTVKPTTELYTPDVIETDPVNDQYLPEFIPTLAAATGAGYTTESSIITTVGEILDTTSLINNANIVSEKTFNDISDLKSTTETIYVEPVIEVNKEIVQDSTVINLNIKAVDAITVIDTPTESSTLAIDVTQSDKSLSISTVEPIADIGLVVDNGTLKKQNDSIINVSLSTTGNVFNTISDNIAKVSSVANDFLVATGSTLSGVNEIYLPPASDVNIATDSVLTEAINPTSDLQIRDTNKVVNDATTASVTEISVAQNNDQYVTGNVGLADFDATEKVIDNGDLNSINITNSSVLVTVSAPKPPVSVDEIAKDLKDQIAVALDTTVYTTTTKASLSEKPTEKIRGKFSESLVDSSTPSYGALGTLESTPSDNNPLTDNYDINFTSQDVTAVTTSINTVSAFNNPEQTTVNVLSIDISKSLNEPIEKQPNIEINTDFQTKPGSINLILNTEPNSVDKINDVNIVAVTETPALTIALKPQLSITTGNKDSHATNTTPASKITGLEQIIDYLNDEFQSTTSIPINSNAQDISPKEIAIDTTPNINVNEVNTTVNLIEDTQIDTKLYSTNSETKANTNVLETATSTLSTGQATQKQSNKTTIISKGDALTNTISSDYPLESAIVTNTASEVQNINGKKTAILKDTNSEISVTVALPKELTLEQNPSTLANIEKSISLFPAENTGESKLYDRINELSESNLLGSNSTPFIEIKSSGITTASVATGAEVDKNKLKLSDTESVTEKVLTTQTDTQKITGIETATLIDSLSSQKTSESLLPSEKTQNSLNEVLEFHNEVNVPNGPMKNDNPYDHSGTISTISSILINNTPSQSINSEGVTGEVSTQGMKPLVISDVTVSTKETIANDQIIITPVIKGSVSEIESTPLPSTADILGNLDQKIINVEESVNTKVRGIAKIPNAIGDKISTITKTIKQDQIIIGPAVKERVTITDSATTPFSVKTLQYPNKNLLNEEGAVTATLTPTVTKEATGEIVNQKEITTQDQIAIGPAAKESVINTASVTTPYSAKTLQYPTKNVLNEEEVVTGTHTTTVTKGATGEIVDQKETTKQDQIAIDPAAKDSVTNTVSVTTPYSAKTLQYPDKNLLNEEEAITATLTTTANKGVTGEIVNQKEITKQDQIAISLTKKVNVEKSESTSLSPSESTLKQRANKGIEFLIQSDTNLESNVKYSLDKKSNADYEKRNGEAQADVNRVKLESITSSTLGKVSTNTVQNSGVTKSRVIQNVVTPTANTFRSSFTCRYQSRGRYGDDKDCRKFYICIGRQQPIVGMCPLGTVFSEFRKQCTKNLSYCVRKNQFHCVSRGRYGDLLKNNVYYLCVRTGENTFVRYTFQCQTGYYLNKTLTRCMPIIKTAPKTVAKVSKKTSEKSAIKKSDESKSSAKSNDKSTNQNNSGESGKNSELIESICDDVGKYADPEDCRVYYICYKDRKSEMKIKTKKCESDEVFHKEKKKCVDTESYECNTN